MRTTTAGRTPHAGHVQWTVVILCFLAVLLDGFDTAALALAIPTLSGEWELPPAGFTVPIVMTNVGVVIGYSSAGFLGARVPGRILLIGSVLLFAIPTLVTAATLHLESIPVLAATRLVTGLGLGLVLPTGIALAARHSADRRRELVSVAVTLGLATGTGLGGFLGARLLRGVGTDGIFYIGGVVPLLLAAALAWMLPADKPAVGSAGTIRHEAKLGRLFDAGLRLPTFLIWTFSFLIFITSYTLISWVPTLLTGYGFAPSEAPLGLTFLTLGGLVGGVLLIPLAARVGIARALILMPAIGAVSMFILAKGSLGDTLLLLVLAGVGFGIVASQIGQMALAVAAYPAGTRTTGVGWAAALGRLGSIVGPGIAGILLALLLSAQNIVLVATVPVLLAIVCAVVLWRTKAGTQDLKQSPADDHTEMAVVKQ